MTPNQKPTGAVEVYGSAYVGAILRSKNSLADADGLGTLLYQWLLDGQPLVGATSNELLLSELYIGKEVSLQISYLDGRGFEEKVLSGRTYSATSYDLYTSQYWISSNAVLENGLRYVEDSPLTVMQTIQIDWNADGMEDILTYDSYPLNIPTPNPPPSIFINNGTALVKTPWNGPNLSNPHGVKLLLGDFNEDGYPDIFSLVAVDPPFGQFPNLQDFNHILFSGPKIALKEFPQFKGFWYAGASGDINNDSHIDVVMFNFHVANNGVQNQILWNDGKANFRFDTNGLVGLQVDQAELRDINRDGYLDLVIDKLDSQGRHVNVLWGNGANFDINRKAAFDLPSSFFVGNLSFADLNNDRLDEILVSGVDDKGVYGIFIYGSKDKGKTFDNITNSSIENYLGVRRFDHIKISDLDNDGLLDIYSPDMADNIRWEWNGSIFKQVTTPITDKGLWEIKFEPVVFLKEPVQPILLMGTAFNDTLVGTDFQDKIEALAGNDTIQGGLRNDVIDGGDGIDVVKLFASYTSKNAGNYAVKKSSENIWTVEFIGPVIAIYPPPITEGLDTLVNVERLQFADFNLALDLNGNAGITALILGAVYGANQVNNKVYVGIGLELLDKGISFERLIGLALEDKLGIKASNAQVIDLLYRNLTYAPADPNSIAYWSTQIDTGTYSHASLAMMAAKLNLNAENINLMGLIQTGLEYIPA